MAGAKNRVWVVSGANLDNITRLPNGKPAISTDELGFFVVTMSSDGGSSWSNFSTIPLRQVTLTTKCTSTVPFHDTMPRLVFVREYARFRQYLTLLAQFKQEENLFQILVIPTGDILPSINLSFAHNIFPPDRPRPP